MMRHFLSCLLMMFTLAAAPAVAGTLNKVPAALDPAKAYVVVEIGKLDDGLLYGTLVLGRYDVASSDIAVATPPPGGKIPKGGWKHDNRVFLLKPAVKAGDRRLYIAELDPGLWVIEGANDTAFSLGSSTLQLTAGSVTDLGVATVYSDFPEGEKRHVLTAGRALTGALLGGIFGSVLPASMPKAIDIRARAASDIALPSVLAGAARPVEWSGEVRFGNHLGGLVNRMGGRKARFRAIAAEQEKMQTEGEVSEKVPGSQVEEIPATPAEMDGPG
jgi:hypothetical protein